MPARPRPRAQGFAPPRAAAWLAAALLAASAAPARAADTLGDLVHTLGKDVTSPVMILLVAVAYLGGFSLVATGLLRMKDASERGGGDSVFVDAILRLFGGALLIALPDTFGAGLYTLYNQGFGYQASLDGHLPVAPNSCVSFGGGGSQAPLECAAKNFALNVVPIFVEVTFVMFYVFGATMVVHAIYTMATSHSRGERGLPKGWWGRLVIGFLVCNVPHLMGAIQATLGVSGGVIGDAGMDSGSSLLSYEAPGGLGALAQYGALIQWLFFIFVMFGVIAVWRGIVHLKAFADGSQQGTLGSGLTHIVGGVLLANAKFSVCVMVNTVLGMQAGAFLGFC